MDEARLIDKLRRIEALFAGATTEGEKVAADRARGRILERLKAWEKEAPPIEYRFTMGDMWSRKVFVALLRRYELQPYRYSGQRYTTVMARVSKRFVDETLWPEFQEISTTLRDYLTEVTDRVVHQVIHKDSSEAAVVEEPLQLPLPSGESSLATDSPMPPANRDAGQQLRPTGKAPGAGGKARAKNKRKKGKKRRRRSLGPHVQGSHQGKHARRRTRRAPRSSAGIRGGIGEPG